MKPLVYYCRWQGATLRLRGRDNTAVWGELVYVDKAQPETTETFYFDLKSRVLTLGERGAERSIQLDEMGTVVS